MALTGEGGGRTLAELRAEIDRIDAAMHGLLIERSAVIDELISVKGTTAPGAAFRPAREADMIRRLAARHRGALPLATAEHIWRVIIATFTHMQSAFEVVFDGSGDAEAMRDLARFQFGFDVTLTRLPDAAAVIETVATTGAALGLVGAGGPYREGAWWRALAGATRPKIMAAIPFIRRGAEPPRPLAFVVFPRLADPPVADLRLVAARSTGEAGAAGRFFGEALLLAWQQGAETELLLGVEGEDDTTLAKRAAAAGLPLGDLADVGAIAKGVVIDGPAGLLYQSAG